MTPMKAYAKMKEGFTPVVVYDIIDGMAWCFHTGENGGRFGWEKIKLNKIFPAEFKDRAQKKLEANAEKVKAEKRVCTYYATSDGDMFTDRNLAIGREMNIIRAEQADGSALKEVVERLDDMKTEEF